MKNPTDSIYSTISNPSMVPEIESRLSIYSFVENPNTQQTGESLLLDKDSYMDLESTNITKYSDRFIEELGS